MNKVSVTRVFESRISYVERKAQNTRKGENISRNQILEIPGSSSPNGGYRLILKNTSCLV